MFNKISNLVLLLTVLASSSLHTNSVEAQAIKRGLVAYWTFDEANVGGDTVEDIIGDYDGTINGNRQIVEGKIGEALKFAHQKNDFVDFGVDINEDLTQPLTIDGWIKFTELEVELPQIVMCSRKGAWTNGTGITLIYVNNYKGQGFTLSLRFHHEKGTCDLLYQPFNPNVEEWYHYAATYDGAVMRSYINGVSMDSAQLACAEGVKKSFTSLKIADSEQFGNQWNFTGAVDEVRLYNRALTEAEVMKNFSSSGGLAVDPSIEKLALTWGKVKISSSR
jgi:hypothetical protein